MKNFKNKKIFCFLLKMVLQKRGIWANLMRHLLQPLQEIYSVKAHVFGMLRLKLTAVLKVAHGELRQR